VTGFEVYKMYLALKNHFTKLDYDYVKYNGKTRASEKSFQGRNDVYFFKKLGTKYSEAEALGYFVSNFVNDGKGYIRNFSDDIYKQWKIHQESFTYKFKQDVSLLLDDVNHPYEQTFETIFKAPKGKHPPILQRYFAQEISLETLVVFETCLGYVSDLDRVLSDPIWKEVRLKILKYQPFLTIDCKKYKRITLETIRTKL
jgi:hypothetical protein